MPQTLGQKSFFEKLLHDPEREAIEEERKKEKAAREGVQAEFDKEIERADDFLFKAGELVASDPGRAQAVAAIATALYARLNLAREVGIESI